MYAIYIITDFIDMFINHKKKESNDNQRSVFKKRTPVSDFLLDLLKVAV